MPEWNAILHQYTCTVDNMKNKYSTNILTALTHSELEQCSKIFSKLSASQQGSITLKTGNYMYILYLLIWVMHSSLIVFLLHNDNH